LAQCAFFENARRYPSHETYNNIGYFLITEGFFYKSGSSRCGLSSGKKYLFEAASLRTSEKNTHAIIKALDYGRAGDNNREKLLRQGISLLERALAVQYSDSLTYELIRYSYLLCPKDEGLSSRAQALIKDNPYPELISLYLEILRKNRMAKEGEEVIKKYNPTAAEQLLFYSTVGDYSQGYELSGRVLAEGAVNAALASAIIECCLACGKRDEAIAFAGKIAKGEDTAGDSALSAALAVPANPSEERRNILESCINPPPALNIYCYFD